MATPRITKTKAKQLGLEILRLLTLENGLMRRRPPDQPNESLIYGLDGPQEMQRVVKQRGRPTATIPNGQSGIPIRPLCFYKGKVVRAVPIDWDWGVDLMELRAIDPTLT